MLYSPDRTSKWLKFVVVGSFSVGLVLSPVAFAHDEHEKENLAAAADKTLTGEIVDLITLKGKLASNGGIPMLENAEIVKK